MIKDSYCPHWPARLLPMIIGLTVLSAGNSCQQQADPNWYQRAWSDADRQFLMDQLDQSLQEVRTLAQSLNEEQWNWQSDSASWSVAMIIEHLIVHDELFYREVRVLTALPEPSRQKASLFADDRAILSYAKITSGNTGSAPSYLLPLGRWCQKETSLDAYGTIRNQLIQFVQSNTVDLRRHFTESGRGPTQYRDLHQLLLISIAHTQRHRQQIQNLISHPNFPKNT